MITKWMALKIGKRTSKKIEGNDSGELIPYLVRDGHEKYASLIICIHQS
jgi:hypothetical protein